MNYDEALEYLLNKLPMYQRVGAPAIKKDLTNIQSLCELLGNPQEQFPSIHIAGTNGKGSVNHILSSILMEAGYKTGYHISPHLTSYRERIVIN
ncbi:MAG: dihydrofolate synthase, partial [Bacteroidetes bacterium SW_10_40_5]